MKSIEMFTNKQAIEINKLLSCEVDYETELDNKEEHNLCELRDTTGKISFFITQDSHGFLNVWRKINGKYYAILGDYADYIAEKYS